MTYQLEKQNPIAVFDSGVGGISVLRELVKIMPQEDYIYFGDSKNAPYGMKEQSIMRKPHTAVLTQISLMRSPRKRFVRPC